jgi:hypothetical protein
MGMIMQDAFQAFKRNAMLLEREEGLRYDAKPRKETIGRLLDGYCDAMDRGDERKKDQYTSGLMLSLWYKIKQLVDKSPGLSLEFEDYMSWIYEAIAYAAKYRKWQDPAANVNAQQCLMQCVETIRLQHYYELNLDKNKANVGAVSFEHPMDDDGKMTLEDTIADSDDDDRRKEIMAEDAARTIVQAFVDQKRLVEAIIMDVIAFNDARKIVKKTVKAIDSEGNPYKYVESTSEFWPFRCVQLLNALPEKYQEYFLSHYDAVPAELEAAIASVRGSNNQKLYRSIESARKKAKAIVLKEMRGV